ncbi:hypothetical protein KPH14_011923 [Odynerus spinipes]|uniref:RNA-directed DNA polymerase n=1 Tax=Odynerus spinipes TaxID=1348599 RepID=A0AAD9RFX6_9HYME|nr:hypothetical protein KPH14_011923 [Odynerus spinipes]
MFESAKDWYSAVRARLTIESEWTEWKRIFLETFADKSWKQVHYAYKFKWISGSLLDYALKKEKLLLETEPEMTTTSRINHIVVGLPSDIHEKLDKEEITTTEKLMNQLRRYSSATDRIPSNPPQKLIPGIAVQQTKNKNKAPGPTVRKPCSICESIGKPNRYHPPEICWNRKINNEKKTEESKMLNVLLNRSRAIEAVYDSGSNVTLIDEKLIKDFEGSVKNNTEFLRTISGVQKSNSRVRVALKIHKREHLVDMYVVKNNNFSYNILLGLDTIKQFCLSQDENLNILQRTKEDKLERVSATEKGARLPVTCTETLIESDLKRKLRHLQHSDQKGLLKALRTHSAIFTNNKYDVGQVKNEEAQIRLTEHRYISKKPYRCSIPDQEEIDSQVSNLLKADLIEESSSPFAAPVTLAYKKEDGRKSRLCIDFRDLNEILVIESQPFPRIEDTISEVRYLGHVLGCNTVRPQSDNLTSIRNFPEPTSKKNVRQFLGKVNFYHKYIPNSAKLLNPLHELLKECNPFIWSSECHTVFQTVKNMLCQAPILAIFDPAKTTFIFTDASGIRIGAILKQVQSDGELLPVAYFSRKLSPSQKKWKATYLECYAIKEAIRYWQHWLLGIKFTVISDHKPLENLKLKARTDEILGDMVYYLSQNNFSVRYSPGTTNQEADALSRNPVLEEFQNEDDILQIVNMVTLEEIKKDQAEADARERKKNTFYQRNKIWFKKHTNRERIVVSQDFGKKLIHRIHLYYGHIGTTHMINKIRQYYYFPAMDKLVKQYYETCEICKKGKTRYGRPTGFLSQLGPAEKPYQIMSLDTIGGFAGCRSPKKYLHLLVDHFTRYAFAYTSKTQSAKDFIKLVQPILKKNQIQIILADQYPAIRSGEFQRFLKRNRVNIVFTTVNCPSSNGLN